MLFRDDSRPTPNQCGSERRFSDILQATVQEEVFPVSCLGSSAALEGLVTEGHESFPERTYANVPYP